MSERLDGGAALRESEGLLLLAGDIGATNARLGVFQLLGGQLHCLDRQSYESAAFDGLAPVLLEYLESVESQPRRACIAVAAPADGDRLEFPNLDWVVEPDELRSEAGMECLRVINDFDAVAHAIDWLEADDLSVLHPGRVQASAPRALFGAGTGLGVAFAVSCGDGHHVVSSEGGHVDFAPRTTRELRLFEYLRERHARVSYEQVLSGRGLEAIYRSLVAAGFAAESPDVRRRLDAEDPAAVVAELGMAGSDRLCAEALDLFASVYGAQAGNLALLVQARGGVYVAGGIAPRILPKLRDGSFVRAFRDKGRLSSLVEEIPVFVVTREDVGLLGAAAAALGGGS